MILSLICSYEIYGSIKHVLGFFPRSWRVQEGPGGWWEPCPRILVPVSVRGNECPWNTVCFFRSYKIMLDLIRIEGFNGSYRLERSAC